MREQLPADAIIVLGGGVDIHGTPSSSTQHRLHTAIDLYHQKRAPHLVFTGRWSSHLVQPPPLTEAEAMQRYATARGVNPSDISLETQATNTAGNAYHCKVDIITPNNWQKILLVTSPAHMQRSRLLFEWMLGEECVVETQASAEPRIQQASELAGYLALRRALRSIRPGDHQRIGTLLLGNQLVPQLTKSA